MTITNALNGATAKITKAGSKTAALDAEVLLAFILGRSKEYLYTYPEKKLTVGQQKKYDQAISRRIKGEPVAYIRGFKEFYGLEFIVNKDVLIPRPETELLVEEVGKLASWQVTKNKVLVIADIGTGCGAIAVTLAKLIPQAKIYASDISANALKIARKNVRRHGVKVKFLQGDLLLPLKNTKIDVIAANLPYGWMAWKNNSSMESTSLKFEPKRALFTGEKGLLLYRRLFKQIAIRKQQPKFIFCEFDPRQMNDLIKLVKTYLPGYQKQIKKDLSGQNRLLIISNP